MKRAAGSVERTYRRAIAALRLLYCRKYGSCERKDGCESLLHCVKKETFLFLVAVNKGKWVTHLQVSVDLVGSQIDVSVVGTHHLLGNTLDHVASLTLEQRVRLHPVLQLLYNHSINKSSSH